LILPVVETPCHFLQVGREGAGAMPQKQKINLDKVLASLNTTCQKCGYSIAPAEIRRVDFERVECPECGEHFIPRSRK